MEGRRTTEEVRSAFRDLAGADRARGGLRSLGEYQKLFAGCDDVVAAEFSRIAAASEARPDPHDGITVESRGQSPVTEVSCGPPASEAVPDLGRVGPYRLVRELGSGGMGKVYRAVCEKRSAGLHAGQEVALKVVHAHLTESEGFFKRFLREADIGKRVHHPNVVRTLDVDAATLDGKPVHYLVMEYVEGQTLRSLFAEVGRVPEALCLHIAREAGKGLAAIHQLGVVHRDFKPENVLITRDHAVKVMDLGVARLVDEAVRLSLTGAFLGTVPYAAPEQFLGGGKDIDGRADLYALGLTLYELATGQHPFMDDDLMAMLRRRLNEQPRPPSALNPQLSPFFEEVVKTLVSKERDGRFASATELVGVLQEGEASSWWRRRSGEIRVATKRPLRRIRIQRDTAIFGREEEIAKLLGLWTKAKGGEGQVVFLEGEAGIGKSRLVDEFAGALQQEGEDLNFLFGSFPPAGAATAAGAFVTAYREQLGVEDLEGCLASYLDATPLLVPAFAALLRGEPPPQGTEPLTKETLQTAFVEGARAFGRERPTMILVDDLHYAPEEGRALFAALAQAMPGQRVLLVGTARTGLPVEWIAGLDRMGHMSRLAVGRLGPKDLHRLLVDAFRSGRLAEELGGRIGAKSDGNPFFVFEILRSLREGGALRRGSDGTWGRTSEIREIEIPSSVTDLIRARTVRLEEQERNLLDVAACCGFEFDPILVGDVLGLGRIPVLQRLAGIEKAHRLVRSAGRRFAFDHHQVQEVLYAGLPELLREEYHAAIGEALERREGAAGKDPGELPGGLTLELCHHFLEGGRKVPAGRYLDAALKHLDGEYRTADAIVLLERALVRTDPPGPRRIDLRLREVKSLETLGRNAEWKVAVDDAFALAEASMDAAARIRARFSMARYLNRRAEHGAERALLEEALSMARSIGDRKLEVEIHHGIASYHHAQSRFAEALECHRRALALVIEIGDKDLEVMESANVGAQLCNLGRYEESIPHSERALAHAREKGHRRLEQGMLTNLSITSNRTGRFAEARVQSERSLELARGMGDPAGELFALAAVAHTLWNLGDLEESLAMRERQLDRARTVGYRFMEASSLLNLSSTLLDLGALDRVRPMLDEALLQARGAGMVQQEAFILHQLARLAEAMGDEPGAERLYRDSLGLTEREHLLHRGTWESLALGRLLVARGNETEGRLHFENALALAKSRDDQGDVVAAMASLAALPGGDPGAALGVFRSLPRPLPCHSLCHLRFLLWQATRDPAHLAESHRLLSSLRGHVPRECGDSFVSRVPLHRSIAAAWKEHGEAPSE